MIYVVTFLTFHFALVKGAALTDGFNFPHEVEEKELREEDIVKCMDKGDYFMYLDPATNEYLCEELAEKGPCPDNQWFVLDKVNFLEGICKKRDCEEGSVMFKNECKIIGDSCKEDAGSIYLPNPFGEGICGCKENYIPWNAKKKNVDKIAWNEELYDEFDGCYQINTRGPCPEGQQIVNENDEAVCKDTECSSPSSFRWDDNICRENICLDTTKYEVVLGSDDFLSCPDDPSSLDNRNIFVVPKACGKNERKDSSGNCTNVQNEKIKARRGSVRWSTKKNLRQRVKSVYG